MNNFIDIHSHTLWGMDDGSRSFEETVNMCLCAEECETKTLFLTPHLIYWDSAEELYDEREEKTERLSEVLEEEGSRLIIKKGFEILCDDEIFDIKHFLPYTLNESRYILIEFDFRKTSCEDVVSWCKYLKSFGLIPIIAHPERYGFVIDDVECLNKLSDIGALFQINAGSPSGMFGAEAEEISCNMLECGYVDFLGSDAHSLGGRNTDMLSRIRDYPYDVNEELLSRALCQNAQYIIDDREFFPIRIKKIAKI